MRTINEIKADIEKTKKCRATPFSVCNIKCSECKYIKWRNFGRLEKELAEAQKELEVE